MIKLFAIPGLVLGTLLLSVSIGPAPAPALAAPKKAQCVVCREGEEPVKAATIYQGKEYVFCTEKCRDKFLADPAKYVKADVPRPAPAFSLKDLSGKTVSLSDYKGKVVLLDFWATFCGPCIKAMPKLQKLQEELGPKGLVVLGIATDEEGAPKVAPVAARTKVRYPILIANAAAWTDYRVESLPAVFLIDRGGQLVERYGGNVDHKLIEREVVKLLGR